MSSMLDSNIRQDLYDLSQLCMYNLILLMFFLPCRIFFSQRKACVFSNSVCFLHHLSLRTARLINRDTLHRQVRVQPSVQCFVSQVSKYWPKDIQNLNALGKNKNHEKQKQPCTLIRLRKNCTEPNHFVFVVVVVVIFRNKLKFKSIVNIPNNFSWLDSCHFPRIT